MPGTLFSLPPQHDYWLTLPTVRHLFVLHVGHPGADLARRAPTRSGSYEGPGISVSLCPTAWTRIAKLGGAPVYTFRRRDHAFGQFLDMHALTPVQRQMLRRDAQAAGLLSPALLATVSHYDDEFEGELAFTFPSVADAMSHMGCSVGDGAHDHLTAASLGERVARATRELASSTGNNSSVWEHPDSEELLGLTQSFVATPLLETWWHEHFTSRLDAGSCEEMAIACLVGESSLLDGLWWNDELDPMRLSAPRGVIVPCALSSWNCRKAVRRELARAIDDEE